MFSVIISEKGGAERREVFEGSEVSIGRVRGNDLVLSKGNVSKRHARLTQKDGRFVVVDQNSTNGTYVNRQRIVQATIVREGDRIYIGDFVLRIENAEQGYSSPGDYARREGETIDRNSWSGPSPDDLRQPQVPPAPRIPASAAQGMSVAPVDSGPMGEPGRMAKTEASLGAQLTPEYCVSLVVQRVVEKVERRTLERDLSEAVVRRVERALADEVARLRDERALSPRMTEEQLTAAARAELIGLGPLEAIVQDPRVTQITANGTRSVSVVQEGDVTYQATAFSSEESVDRVIARLCRRGEVSHDGRETFISGRLDGGISWRAARRRAAPDGIVLTARRHLAIDCSLEELVRDGVVSRAMATFLGHCRTARASLLVVGSRASVHRVLSAVGTAPVDRWLVALEDHYQLAGAAPSAIRLSAAEAAQDERRLVDFVGSLPEPTLLVENLVTGCLPAVTEIVARGSSGVAGGVYCNTLEQGLGRLAASLARLVPGFSVDTARQTIVSTFDIGVEVCSTGDGRDRVRRIVELVVNSSGITQLQEIFSFTVERTAAGGAVEGSFHATGTEPKLLGELRARGASIDGALFHRGSGG